MGGGGTGMDRGSHRLQEAGPGHSNPEIPLLVQQRLHPGSSLATPPKVPHGAFVSCFRVNSELLEAEVMAAPTK